MEFIMRRMKVIAAGMNLQRNFQAGRMQVEGKTADQRRISAKARRPYNSRLDKSKLTENGFHLLPPWQDALQRYLANKLTDERFLNDYRIGNNNRELGCVSGHIMLYGHEMKYRIGVKTSMGKITVETCEIEGLKIITPDGFWR